MPGRLELEQEEFYCFRIDMETAQVRILTNLDFRFGVALTCPGDGITATHRQTEYPRPLSETILTKRNASSHQTV